MHQRARFFTLLLTLSLAAQPLFGMHTVPASSQKNGLIALAIGSATVIAATISYLLLAKSDKQVCDAFKQKVKTILNNEVVLNDFDEKPVTIPPFSELVSPPRMHDLHHLETIISDDLHAQVKIQHHIKKKYGLHFHELIAEYDFFTPGKNRSISTSAS